MTLSINKKKVKNNKLNSYKIRIIYDYDLTKLINQYNLIKNLFPKHELIIYNNYKDDKLKDLYDINIFIDTINETILFSTPSKINILIVNDEYVIKNKYVRREFYYDKPLILIDNVIHYYFCLTNYSYNILLKNNIDIKKLYLLPGLIDTSNKSILVLNKNITLNNKNITLNNKNITLNNKNNRYILYCVDIYSEKYNFKILNIWLKYFIDLPIKLIIKYFHEKDNIITLFKQQIKVNKLFDTNIYYYKNIIVFKDNKFLNKYYKNIELVILNNSNFDLLYKLFINILNNKYIITINNDITKELLDLSQLYDDFSEKNIHYFLNKYFKLKDEKRLSIIHNNKKNLEDKIKKTNIKLEKFFKNLHF